MDSSRRFCLTPIMPAIEHTFLDTRGFRTHVARAGNGPPLMLLHGWPEFWATWEPMFARLGDRYRLIAPDFRGFGESGNPNPGPSDQANGDILADDIVAVLDALGLARVGFVGHDVGTTVMQSLALRYPERVAGLFFFNCATHGVGQRWREPSQINEIWYQTFHQMPYTAALIGASRDSAARISGIFSGTGPTRRTPSTPCSNAGSTISCGPAISRAASTGTSRRMPDGWR